MGFRQNGTFASKKEADDEEIGYHLVGPGLYGLNSSAGPAPRAKSSLTKQSFR